MHHARSGSEDSPSYFLANAAARVIHCLSSTCFQHIIVYLLAVYTYSILIICTIMYLFATLVITVLIYIYCAYGILMMTCTTVYRVID